MSEDIPIGVPCFPPPTIPNGKHSGTDRDDYEYGSAVTYNCDSGFSLIGDKTIVCVMDKNDMNGKWSGSAPRCEVIECRGPEISNGRIVSSYQPSYTYGNTVTFECYREYILRGENVIKCEANSTWHPAPPVCALRRSCGDPGKPKNGRLTEPQDFSFGSIIHFICDKGYRLIGQPSIQCVILGQKVAWSGEIPICQCNVTSDFSSQEPAVTVATNISILPTLQTELPSGKLFMILQEIKETVNLKAKSLEERLVGLEKKMDKIINEFKPCCQPAKEERLEEENAY
uniref:Uncharacterized protein n=1 Tax=Sphaerodactylus townsendi TaxID=933632 RepID=A0ACB8F516_9SAUR